MDIIITDLTGNSFTIKLNWDICIMKQDISKYYEEKIFSDYLIKNNILNKREFYLNDTHRMNWLISEELKSRNKYHPDYIQLIYIYKNEILEQYHIEIDRFTYEDFKENNNINVVITETEYDSINMEPRGDYDVDYDDYDVYDDDN